jgi:hypothetical protein
MREAHQAPTGVMATISQRGEPSQPQTGQPAESEKDEGWSMARRNQKRKVESSQLSENGMLTSPMLLHNQKAVPVIVRRCWSGWQRANPNAPMVVGKQHPFSCSSPIAYVSTIIVLTSFTDTFHRATDVTPLRRPRRLRPTGPNSCREEGEAVLTN